MELLFNPHYNDIFAICNNNVSYHQMVGFVSDTNEIETSNFLTKGAEGTAEVKCMDWHPSPEYSHVIALGQANGRIVLNWTSLDSQSNNNLAGKEFVQIKESKHLRQCNSLAWNKIKPELIASGLDKHRSGSLLIWDVHTTPESQPTVAERKSKTVTKPLLELLAGETVNSLAWVGQDATTIAVGFSKKALRIYDIRSSSSNYITNKMTNSKSTCGICVDPLSENRIASFGEGTASIWDPRNLTKPYLSITSPHNVARIQWCPTRRGMLACLLENSAENTVEGSSIMRVYSLIDARYSENEAESYDYYPQLRSYPQTAKEGELVSGFAWDPVNLNCVLTSSKNFKFHMTKIFETTSLGGYMDNNVLYTRGHDIFTCKENKLAKQQNQIGDITNDNEKISLETIIERAKNNYGLQKDDPLSNFKLSLQLNNKSLYLMWEWIDLIHHLSFSSSNVNPVISSPLNSPQSPSGWFSNKTNTQINLVKQQHNLIYNQYCLGAQEIIKESQESSHKSSLAWRGVSDTSNVVYTSAKRDLVLSMCDWGNINTDFDNPVERYSRNGPGEDLVKRINKNGEIERSIAIAVWHLNLELAIEVINNSIASGDSSSEKLPSVAMALSGYSGSKSLTLWLSTCKTLQSSLQNAYLQATFQFLIQNSESKRQDLLENYIDILYNKDILLKDRIGFACLHLSDSSLHEFLQNVTKEVISDGKLDGLLVTGFLLHKAIPLLQNYIDKTSDMQTPLLAIAYSHEPKTKLNDKVLHWKNSYWELLNKSQLFFERVNFDLFWSKMFNSKRKDGEVYFHCNYCNKAVSSTVTVIPGRGRIFMGGAMQNPVMSCPSCRKPLPRCSVCSLHLGTRPDDARFADWTSWCLSCRHGGHQLHLAEWFQKNKTCPVSDCSCLCYSTDND